MMRITELPHAIRNAISDWRLWITLSLTAALIINETIIGLRAGRTIMGALTGPPFYKVFYLLLVCSIISQAAIGAVPFTTGVLMTLYDIALARRRGWKEEGRQEGIKESGERMLRTYIAAILADETLTAEEKTRFIAILNSATPE